MIKNIIFFLKWAIETYSNLIDLDLKENADNLSPSQKKTDSTYPELGSRDPPIGVYRCIKCHHSINYFYQEGVYR